MSLSATALASGRWEEHGRPSSVSAGMTQGSREAGCPKFPLLRLPKDVLHMVVRAVEAGGGGQLEDGGGDARVQQRPGSNPLLPLRLVCRALRESVDANFSWLTLDIKAEGDLPPLQLARLEQQLHTLLPRRPRLEQLNLCMEQSTSTRNTIALVSAAADACPDLQRLALLPNRTHDCRFKLTRVNWTCGCRLKGTRDYPLVPFPVHSLSPFRRLRSLTVWSHGSQYSLGLGTGIALSETLPLLEELVLLEGSMQSRGPPLPAWNNIDSFGERSSSSPNPLANPPVFDLARLNTATNLQRLRITRHNLQHLRPPHSLRALELCFVKFLNPVELFECPSLTKLELRSVLTSRYGRDAHENLLLRNVINQLATQTQLTSLALEGVHFDVPTLSRASRWLKSLELIRIMHGVGFAPVVLPAIPSEHLTRLLVSDSRLDFAAMEHSMWEVPTDVSSLHGRGTLKELRYLDLELPDECALQIHELGALSSLEHLFVRRLQVLPMLLQEPLSSIPRLRFLKRLVLLDLKGTVDIENSPLLPSLTALVLSRGSFMRLSGMMFPKLESLMISKICGKEKVREISGAPKLKQLGVNWCKDGGELHLKDLPELEVMEFGFAELSKVVLSRVPLVKPPRYCNIEIVEI